MPEWTMPTIVAQRSCFRECYIEPTSAGNCHRDLRDFERMCQPRSLVVSWEHKDLRFAR